MRMCYINLYITLHLCNSSTLPGTGGRPKSCLPPPTAAAESSLFSASSSSSPNTSASVYFLRAGGAGTDICGILPATSQITNLFMTEINYKTICNTVLIHSVNTMAGHPSVGRHNEYWWWSRSLLRKKRRVLLNSGPVPGLLAYWHSWLKALVTMGPAIWLICVVCQLNWVYPRRLKGLRMGMSSCTTDLV